MSDTEIKAAGVRALVEALGEVQAEPFISLIQRETFNYTEWQRTLWPQKSIDEVNAAAMQERRASD